jgi:hypothetical protein
MNPRAPPRKTPFWAMDALEFCRALQPLVINRSGRAGAKTMRSRSSVAARWLVRRCC